MSNYRALIAGATGIVGLNLASHLTSRGEWTVFGLARKPGSLPSVQPVAADLLQPHSLRAALEDIRPTHVFITTWMRQPTEAENIRINSALVRNLLEALSPSRSVEHVALVTGLKHYLGPFEAYGKGRLPATPFREDQERLPLENFYYAQEDEVFAASGRDGFSWSVHRPHTIVGYAVGNAMNMGVTLAAYATICRETGRPFVFPGSTVQWNGLTDMTDARLLARHLEWAATTPAARNQAFNVVNGDVFRWQWMWNRLAQWFEIQAAVNEEREQTQAIHRLQRERQTLAGILRKQKRQALIQLHQNAQRLLKPLFVVNPYALELTFPDNRTRLRRDHSKYLSLISAIALLYQHQRPVKTAHGVSYVEATREDIDVVDRLMKELLARSLDELPPQTRKLLTLIARMVNGREDFRFSRKDVREYTQWGNTQLKVHLHRLEDLEYLIVHRGGRGQSFVYELNWSGPETEKSGLSRGEVGHLSAPGRVHGMPINTGANGVLPHHRENGIYREA